MQRSLYCQVNNNQENSIKISHSYRFIVKNKQFTLCFNTIFVDCPSQRTFCLSALLHKVDTAQSASFILQGLSLLVNDGARFLLELARGGNARARFLMRWHVMMMLPLLLMVLLFFARRLISPPFLRNNNVTKTKLNLPSSAQGKCCWWWWRLIIVPISIRRCRKMTQKETTFYKENKHVLDITLFVGWWKENLANEQYIFVGKK